MGPSRPFWLFSVSCRQVYISNQDYDNFCLWNVLEVSRFDVHTEFEVFRNSVLLGFGEQSLSTSTPYQCQEECIKAQQNYKFNCLSVLFYPDEISHNCILNSESKITQPAMFLRSTEDRVDYYQHVGPFRRVRPGLFWFCHSHESIL